MGVSFFLVLSGFVMSLGYADKVRRPDFHWGSFMKKRLIRLWPLHILCLLIWIVAAGMHSTFELQPLPLLGNLFLLQGWIPLQEAQANIVAWCLSDLILFYALFPWLVRMPVKQLALFLVIYGAILITIGSQIPEKASSGFFLRDWFYYFFPLSRLIDFILGILVYHAYRHAEEWGHVSWWKKASASTHFFIELVPIILLILTSIFADKYNDPGDDVYPFFLPSCLLIYILALAHKSGDQAGIPAWIAKPWLIYMGEISFSFYMIHYLVILITNRVFSWIYPENPWPLRLLVTLGITIVGSILINKYFEQPIARLLSRKGNK